LQQFRSALLQPLQFGFHLCGAFAVHRDVTGGSHASPEIESGRCEAVRLCLGFRFALSVVPLWVQDGLRL